MPMALGLRPDQIEFRRNLIGGSDATIIMSGDPVKIGHLMQQKRGEREPEDLSDVLPVQMGLYTEPFNRAWFSKQTNRTVTDVGGEVISLEYPFMGCTKDGMTVAKNGEPAVFQAKHVSAFAKPDETHDKYYPQVTHEMIVTETRYSILSVFYGTLKWEFYEIELNEAYAKRLIEAETAFWEGVKTGQLPEMPDYLEPEKLTPTKIVDMHGHNEWGDAAALWLESRPHALTFEGATKQLKNLAPEDAKETFGHGVRVVRAKNGAATIKEG